MKYQRYNLQLTRRSFVGSALVGAAGFFYTPRNSVAQTAGKSDKLIVRSVRPEDLETPVALLNSWITPNELFYVRSHLYAPEIKAGEWSLTVDGEVQHQLTLGLDDVRRMPRASAIVTLECAGNGRSYYEPPVAGVQWEKGAVGTARWTGVRLRDVLARAGLKRAARFVLLDGADESIGKVPDFIRNVPIQKALHPDTLLAYEMNGVPLPPQHGFPLRAIVPGWEGAYAVKWLKQVRAIDREHDGFFVKTAYRFPSKPPAPGSAVDPKDMVPLTGLVIKSIITSPADGAKARPGPVVIQGFAWAGEVDVVRVDVSTDGGTTWQAAKLGLQRAPYAWREFTFRWRAMRPGSYAILSRAVDSRGRSQPLVAQWNPSGYLWNVVDRVRIDVEAS
ncbi:MAG TPA: sulfite oxidase [Blastocatellia bacterium]|nr:sulfite oxidase [Blastocatellia bacterium]